MMKKNKLDSQRLKALFPATPPAFTAFVEKNLNDLKEGKEIPVMKKKLSLALVLALVLTLLLVAVAVAAMLSPTAEIFGFLYGKEKQEALLKGDIASIGQTHASGDLDVTIEEVVYQAEGDMPGLYGTGIIAPKVGSKVVLIPEDYSVNDPAGYAVHYGRDVEIPADAPSYAELAEQSGARMLVVRVLPDSVAIDGKTLEADVGYSLIPQDDGTVRFAFEIVSDQMQRAENYDLSLYLGFREIDAQGETGELARDRWIVRAVPALSQTAKAVIAAQTPVPGPTQAPPPAPGAIRIVGSMWGDEEAFLAEYPDRRVENIRVEYNGQYAYIANPDNAWDVAFMFLTAGDFESLVKAGRLMNLSDDPVIAQKIARMYPALRSAVTREGKAYALPSGIFGGTLQFGAGYDETWAQLGLGKDLMPKTFADLCALAETYMNIPLEERKGTTFLQNDSVAASRYVLLDYLVRIRFGEALREGGSINFDTPAFREALAQIEQATEALKGKQAGPDSKGTHYALIWENSNSMIEENNLFLRLGDTPAYTADVAVLMVNANAVNKEGALAYARWLSGNLSGQFLSLLDQEVSAQEIALHKIKRDLALRKATGSDPEDIARMEERLKNGEYADYGPKEEALARYRREVGPNLIVMTRRLPDVVFEAQDNYLKGAMDMDTFIKALQVAAKEITEI